MSKSELIGFLVNPEHKTVQKVSLPTEITAQLQKMYELINCNMIEAIYVADVTGFCDEEGLIHNPEHFCNVNGWPHPVAGNILFVGGPDFNGNSKDFPHSVRWIQQNVLCKTFGKDDSWQPIKEIL